MLPRRIIQWFWNLGKPGSPLPVLVLGAAILFWIQLQRDIHDVDIFWQLKLGELTLAGGLPSHEPFLAGKENEPLAAVCWLSQVLYAIIRMIGGWPLLRLVDAAIWFSGYYIVARHCSRRAGNDWPALAGLFVGWYAAIPFASLRPQSFAVLCFGLLIVLVRSDISSRRKLIFGSLLLVAWQNLHPSVVIGVGYLGAFATVEWARHFLRLQTANNQRGLFTILMLIAVLATVLTPAGSSIFAISKYNGVISKERGITEWQTMFAYGGLDWGRDYAWPGVLLTFVLLPPIIAVGYRRVSAADALVVIGLTAVSLYCHRFIMFWGVAVIPLWATALAFSSSLTPRKRWRLPLAIAVVLGIIVQQRIERPAPFCSYYPFHATRALKHSDIRGTIYCNYFWGGVLADAGHPDWKVSHDGRYYLFTRDEWAFYDDASVGKVPLKDVLDRFHPDAFVLRKNVKLPDGTYLVYDGALISQLEGLRWQVVFDDEQSIVFIR